MSKSTPDPRKSRAGVSPIHPGPSPATRRGVPAHAGPAQIVGRGFGVHAGPSPDTPAARLREPPACTGETSSCPPLRADLGRSNPDLESASPRSSRDKARPCSRRRARGRARARARARPRRWQLESTPGSHPRALSAGRDEPRVVRADPARGRERPPGSPRVSPTRTRTTPSCSRPTPGVHRRNLDLSRVCPRGSPSVVRALSGLARACTATTSGLLGSASEAGGADPGLVRA